MAGHAENAVTLALGYGRTRAGAVGTGVGFDAGRVRDSRGWWADAGATVTATGARLPLALAQLERDMQGRAPVRVERPAAPRRAPATQPAREERATMLPPVSYAGQYKWGMVIDLDACTGCMACVVACQAENNIPTVGKDQVRAGRRMHWLRVDSYARDGREGPATLFQPVPCMHCEHAPCELVCPVMATTHSAEGLNEMTYNRCVGTRYCSNNCPYKVRRFNFFHYSDVAAESLKAARNPEVSVRARGVMEKCTYCVQRLNEGRVRAELRGRRLTDGEVVTACAQACPTEAIAFGDLNDTGSLVARLRGLGRHYELLGELGTRPRTTYLARLDAAPVEPA
jgi:molybdopterin-containing oxidoreductase family iron-sulfur binding subunit